VVDSGKYTCVGNNEAGSDEGTATLTVNGEEDNDYIACSSHWITFAYKLLMY